MTHKNARSFRSGRVAVIYLSQQTEGLLLSAALLHSGQSNRYRCAGENEECCPQGDIACIAGVNACVGLCGGQNLEVDRVGLVAGSIFNPKCIGVACGTGVEEFGSEGKGLAVVGQLIHRVVEIIKLGAVLAGVDSLDRLAALEFQALAAVDNMLIGAGELKDGCGILKHYEVAGAGKYVAVSILSVECDGVLTLGKLVEELALAYIEVAAALIIPLLVVERESDLMIQIVNGDLVDRVVTGSIDEVKVSVAALPTAVSGVLLVVNRYENAACAVAGGGNVFISDLQSLRGVPDTIGISS